MRFRAPIMMLCICWLPMGGVGPHQITGFLFALKDEDITLKALDDFQTQVRKGSQRLLRRNFFQQRPVRENDIQISSVLRQNVLPQSTF